MYICITDGSAALGNCVFNRMCSATLGCHGEDSDASDPGREDTPLTWLRGSTSGRVVARRTQSWRPKAVPSEAPTPWSAGAGRAGLLLDPLTGRALLRCLRELSCPHVHRALTLTAASMMWGKCRARPARSQDSAPSPGPRLQVDLTFTPASWS